FVMRKNNAGWTSPSSQGSATSTTNAATFNSTPGFGDFAVGQIVPVPTVTALNPTSGPTGGGTQVAITGTNLTGATAVKFGATNAASFTVNSATSISAVSPSGGAGVVNVTVTTANGTSATGAGNQFTYLASPSGDPTVTAVSPSSGP